MPTAHRSQPRPSLLWLASHCTSHALLHSLWTSRLLGCRGLACACCCCLHAAACTPLPATSLPAHKRSPQLPLCASQQQQRARRSSQPCCHAAWRPVQVARGRCIAQRAHRKDDGDGGEGQLCLQPGGHLMSRGGGSQCSCSTGEAR